jgi:hypothetical protein
MRNVNSMTNEQSNSLLVDIRYGAGALENILGVAHCHLD